MLKSNTLWACRKTATEAAVDLAQRENAFAMADRESIPALKTGLGPGAGVAPGAMLKMATEA